MKSENDKVPEWHKIACAMLDDGRYPGEALDCLPYELEMSLKETDERIKRVKPDGGLRSTQVISSIIQQWRDMQHHGSSEHNWDNNTDW